MTWTRSNPPVIPRNCISSSTDLLGSYLLLYASTFARSPLLKASSQALNVCPAGVSGTLDFSTAAVLGGAACWPHALASKLNAKHSRQNIPTSLSRPGQPVPPL